MRVEREEDENKPSQACEDGSGRLKVESRRLGTTSGDMASSGRLAFEPCRIELEACCQKKGLVFAELGGVLSRTLAVAASPRGIFSPCLVVGWDYASSSTPSSDALRRRLMRRVFPLKYADPTYGCCRSLVGDTSTLPSVVGMTSVVLEYNQLLITSSEDVRCFFYLFRPPFHGGNTWASHGRCRPRLSHLLRWCRVAFGHASVAHGVHQLSRHTSARAPKGDYTSPYK